MLFTTLTNALTVMDLKGISYQIGGSAGVPIGLIPAAGGAEFNIIPNYADNNTYYGVTTSAGLGTPGAEGHVEWGETETVFKVNIFDIFRNAYK